MVKIYPVNKHGEQTGPIRQVSDERWKRLQSIKGCCFVEAKKPESKPIELISTTKETDNKAPVKNSRRKTKKDT